jgi:predicted AAA+ superfamily ATPase
MDYIKRSITKVCLEDLNNFPVLTLTGPRQSGKSTLLKHILPDWRYLSLEDLETRRFAENDPKGFLGEYSDRVIIDEVQRTPLLLSQLQVLVDEDRRLGRFAITGSHNLLLLESISQSLAGRTAIRNLLPFSFSELRDAKIAPTDIESAMYFGGYPLAHQNQAQSRAWLDSYLQTYVERDVRLIRNIGDLSSFERFVSLCAARCSQILDLSGIGNDLGMTHNTVKSWIGILEAGFVCYRLSPYYRNYSKRIIKSPKLYFYDTGLLCRLLNINSASELVNHAMRGSIFENWCVTECLKGYLNLGLRPNIYFWKDRKSEVDLLLEHGSRELLALECKSGKTLQPQFINNALGLREIMDDKEVKAGVVFGGHESRKLGDKSFYSWQELADSVFEFLIA